MGKVDPKQMQRMMKQLGMKTQELNAKRVIFELEDKKIILEEPQVSSIEMQGQKTYTVVGQESVEAGIPEEDVKMVAEQAKVTEEEAKKALEENEGDIAKAIAGLQK